MGQVNRVDSAHLAVSRAGDRARGAVAASDAFFPFADGLQLLLQAGVSAVVQPGGSVRDSEVIDAAKPPVSPCISPGPAIFSTRTRGGSWQLAVIPTIAAFFVGGLTAIQSRANGSLADVLDSGLQAATISFCIGLLLTSIIVMSSAKLRLGVTRLRTAIRGRQIGHWELFGGFFGALFVLSQSLSVPVIGVALFSVALVSGQSASALIVDRLGLGPHGRQPVTAATRLVRPNRCERGGRSGIWTAG